MANEIKLEYEGKPAVGDDVEIDPIKEQWSSYQLSDGTTIKIKNFLSRAIKLRDHRHPDGKPIYFLNIGTNIVTESPEEVIHAVGIGEMRGAPATTGEV